MDTSFLDDLVSHEEVFISNNRMSIAVEGKLAVQGGGHGRIMKCTIKNEKGETVHCVAKPIDHKEAGVYPLIKKTPFADFIPQYFGVHKINDEDCIVIEDLTAGYKSPCVADLKIGTRHWDLEASKEKVDGLVEKQKGTITEKLGIRIIDVSMRRNGEIIMKHDRKQGLADSEEEFKNVIKEFLPGKLLDSVKQKTRELITAYEKTLQENPGFRVYASSILIAYDGDATHESIDDVKVKVIDLAHTYINIAANGADIKDKAYDDGIIIGLKNLAEL